jgi:hypothetical protein
MNCKQELTTSDTGGDVLLLPKMVAEFTDQYVRKSVVRQEVIGRELNAFLRNGTLWSDSFPMHRPTALDQTTLFQFGFQCTAISPLLSNSCLTSLKKNEAGSVIGLRIAKTRYGRYI